MRLLTVVFTERARQSTEDSEHTEHRRGKVQGGSKLKRIPFVQNPSNGALPTIRFPITASTVITAGAHFPAGHA